MEAALADKGAVVADKDSLSNLELAVAWDIGQVHFAALDIHQVGSDTILNLKIQICFIGQNF